MRAKGISSQDYPLQHCNKKNKFPNAKVQRTILNEDGSFLLKTDTKHLQPVKDTFTNM